MAVAIAFSAVYPWRKLHAGLQSIERDVLEGINQFEMSRWQDYSLEDRIQLLTKIGSEARSGEMPIKQSSNPEDRVTIQEQQLIYGWATTERRLITHQLSGNFDKSSYNPKTDDR